MLTRRSLQSECFAPVEDDVLAEIAEGLVPSEIVRLVAETMQELLADGVPAEEIVAVCTSLREQFGISADAVRRALH